MKTIRKISKHPALLLFLSLSIVLFSCGKETLLEPNQMQLSGKDLMRGIYFIDGPAAKFITPMRELKLEQLFNKEQITSIRENVDILLDQIEVKHPGTFAQFKKDITSGDHILISISLSKYASLVEEVTMETFKENNLLFASIKNADKPLANLMDSYFPSENRQDLTPRDVKEILTSENFNKDMSQYFTDLNNKISQNGRTEEQMALIVWFAAVAVVVIYVAAVLAYAAAYAWEAVDWGEIPSNSRSSRSLLKDQVINAIAENFVQFR